ncbi:DNA-binding LacI/PurR family transcriptional regulator [Mesorhizobium robiniae]|uniref:DNA-binding LacI/PurR family transcriptional regulator n=1 Tax=Mesorhizobium robiniae TaxID=559315 RepID=A0ABV2GFV3_9HYPH
MNKLKQRATIKDVALAAGVSPMTVSNVLNGRMQYVGVATRKRVEHEIERLNYRRSTTARNLRVAEQRSIGMVIVDESPAFLADFFTCQVVAGLTNVLNVADYTLTLQGVPMASLARSMIVRNYEVAGFCAMISGPSTERNGVIQLLAGLEQPLIVFQEELAGPSTDICTVRQDDRGGGRLIGDHLLARKVRRPVMIVPMQHWPAVENRVAGVRDAIATSGSEAELTIVHANSESFADVQAAMAGYLDSHPMPDAVIGANDQIAVAAMLLLNERGVKVPDQARVIGFNGFESHRYSQPHLTTVLSPAYSMGECAGRAMLHRLKTGAFARKDEVLPVVFENGVTT